VAVDVQEMTGTGHFPRCAYKCYLQSYLSFGYSIALKKYDEPVLVLRHERWFPSPPAALVEKIGQCVFIFTRMPGELDYDGLVFFHAEGKMKIC